MSVEYTARGSGYYRVFVDGDQVSQHIAEREAIERATNEAESNPDAVVRYDHDYEVDVVAVISVAPPVDTTAPTVTSVTVNTSGNQFTFNTDEPVYFGAGGSGGFAATMSDGATTLTYSSGEGTQAIVCGSSRTINSGETGTAAYTQPTNGVEDASGNDLATFSGISVTNNSTTTGSGTYTATHYVAPFASVSGATNDYDDLGATSWSNATSSGTPTTLGTACARAVGGNKVQCGAGVYTGLDLQDRTTGAFHAAGGSSGNRAVFFAQYPAASNYGSTSIYSEIRRTPLNFQGNCSPALASDGYTIFDGFYADESTCPSAPNGGIFQVVATDVEYRRCVVDRDDTGTWAYGAGYNANAIYFAETSYNGMVTDCRIMGLASAAFNGISIAIETYSAVNATIQYCTIDGDFEGIFFKSNGSGASANPDTEITAHHNYVSVTNKGIRYQRNAAVSLYQNLVIVGDYSNDKIGLGYDSSVYVIDTNFNVYNNTLILKGNGIDYEPYIAGISWENGALYHGTYRDNLIYVEGGGTSFISLPTPGVDDFSSFTQFDYNHYYRASGTPEWHHNGTDYTSLASWQTAMSGFSVEQNSSYSDPEFTNYAGGDYTLADNAQEALTSSSTGGPVGCYITGSEEIGVRASPTY